MVTTAGGHRRTGIQSVTFRVICETKARPEIAGRSGLSSGSEGVFGVSQSIVLADAIRDAADPALVMQRVA